MHCESRRIGPIQEITAGKTLS